MNEHIYSIGIGALAVALAFFAGQWTQDSLQITTVKVINLALLLGSSFGLIKMLRGTKYDVVAEVFDEGNIAAAVFVVGFVVAIALSLTVVS